ncbi:unnamed protein product [Ranitomeya imitator]|uniref:Uncharacterized protein n=1 Tax=Ranitomeya imitator TaxID=111125 RepID=A0ABN9KVA8_9NEOB|nr:unnamed protein product [Ranitomeya imitator]
MLLAMLQSQECIAVSRDDDVVVSRDCFVIISRDCNAWSSHRSAARSGKGLGWIRGANRGVLQKGLSFCPSYKFDTFTMDMDLHRFFRRLRLLVHFDSSEMSPVTTSDTPRSLISSQSLGLRNKSTYRPPKSSHAVEAFIGIIEQSFSRLRQDIETHKLHTSTNLSTPDFQALQTLRTDNEIVIKPADKGGAIVIMNKSDYTQEIHRQLSDNTVYRLLPTDPTTMIRNLIKETLDPYVEKGVIDGKTQEYLTKDFPITPVFYILPKIHKNLEHPPGRPIVASTESILSPLAIFLEKILTPLTKSARENNHSMHNLPPKIGLHMAMQVNESIKKKLVSPWMTFECVQLSRIDKQEKMAKF